MCVGGDVRAGELMSNGWLTSRGFLVHELHMQVEHLLLGFTLQQLQLLPPTHHVTQIPHLQDDEKKKSNTVKNRHNANCKALNDLTEHA